MKRSILFLGTLLAAAVLAAQEPPAPAAPAPSGDLPEAVVPLETYDAGSVLKGKKLEYTFKVKNNGKAELAILSAKPG